MLKLFFSRYSECYNPAACLWVSHSQGLVVNNNDCLVYNNNDCLVSCIVMATWHVATENCVLFTVSDIFQLGQ